MWRRALALIASGLALAAPAQAATSLDRHGSEVSAYAGAAVWTRWVPPAHRFVVILRRDGHTTRLPVRSSRARFAPDVGPDGRGGLSVVYTRCESHVGRCVGDVYRYDLSTHTERRLPVSARGVSETSPAVWGSRVAFLRGRSPSRGQALLTDGRRVLRRLAGSVLPNGDDGFVGFPTAVDLQARRILFAWHAGPGGCRQPTGDVKLPIERDELWTARAGQAPRRLLSFCDGDHGGFAHPTGAELMNGHAAFLASGPGHADDERAFRFSLSNGALTSTPLPSGVGSFALDGRRLLYARRTVKRTGQGIFTLPAAYRP